MHLFLGSLWRALHWNATTPPVFSLLVLFLFIQQKKYKKRKNLYDMFVWRLDCRLKYICYLLVIKVVIFAYFSGKIRLFLGSLWRALQLTSRGCLVLFVLFFVQKNKPNKSRHLWLIYLCDGWTVVWSMSGTYSEINIICNFWLFLG